MSDDKPFQCTAPGCGQVSHCLCVRSVTFPQNVITLVKLFTEYACSVISVFCKMTSGSVDTMFFVFSTHSVQLQTLLIV